MAYQATARKYRPQAFSDLIGQDHVRLTLQNALRKGRVAHAYLFSGPRGVGKTTVARLLAKAVNCETRAKAEAEGKPLLDEPCNQCSSCREIIGDRHPDVLEIDGASNTGVDHVRDLREQVRYAPARGRHKVYVIDEVHMLSKGAFNALLKTLEEPPPGVIFVFATTEPEKIPPTISSRCQCFDFHRLPPSVIAGQLARIADGEGISVERAALNLLARTAEGSMRDGQSLFDQVVAYAGDRDGGGALREAEVSEFLGLVAGAVVRKVAEMIAQGDARGLLEVVRGIFLEGQDVRQFCLALIGFFRDVLVAEMVADSSGLLEQTPEETQELRALAKAFGREKLYRCFRMAMDAERDIRLATNPQPVLEMSLMRMASLRPAVPLEAVLEKLRSVEAELGLSDRRAGEPPESGGGRGETVDAPAAQEKKQESFSEAPAFPPEAERIQESPPAEPGGSDQRQLWQRLLREIESLKKPVVRYLESGCLVSAGSGQVKIGLAGYNLNRARDHQEVIIQAARRIWGEGSRVLLVALSPPDESGAPDAPGVNGGQTVARGAMEEPAENARRLVEEIIQDADEIFGDSGGTDRTPPASAV